VSNIGAVCQKSRNHGVVKPPRLEGQQRVAGGGEGAPVRGIDFAQFTHVPQPHQWELVDASGFGDFVIIGIGDLNVLRRNAQIESALEAGKRPEGYIYLHMGTAEAQMTEAVRNLEREGYDCPFLWPDIEETRGFSPAAVVSSLQECVRIAEAAGWDRRRRQGIYTGGWFWPGATGNSRDFADMPLWTAFYNTDNDGAWHDEWPVDFSWFSPYGGWADLPRPDRRDTRQYRGTFDLHGLNVDLNWRESRWREEEELDAEGLIRIVSGMTADQKNRLGAILDRRVLNLVGVPDDLHEMATQVEAGAGLQPGQGLTPDLFYHWVKDRIVTASGDIVDIDAVIQEIVVRLQADDDDG
jgi:hypothetical protein